MAVEDTTVITLPKLGESILSATVVRWLVPVGQAVARDEPLVEVATDKVNSEIPSPVSGIVQKHEVGEGEELEVGAPLAIVGDAESPIEPEEKPFHSPAVKRLVSERHLTTLPTGTGANGRVTKKDIEHHLQDIPSQHSSILPLTPMRRAIAEHMSRSNAEIPSAALVTEVDVTALKAFVTKEKPNFKKQHGVSLTITTYLLEAVVAAAKAYPHVNATFSEKGIELHKHINVGIAMHVEEGLVVPVLRSAETLPLSKKAIALDILKKKAKTKLLDHQDLAGATITLTNFGMSGIEMGIPVVPYGQTAIVGVGSVQKKVVALDDGSIAVRDRVSITVSFDHRVMDGIYACDFLNAIKQASCDLAH